MENNVNKSPTAAAAEQDDNNADDDSVVMLEEETASEDGQSLKNLSQNSNRARRGPLKATMSLSAMEDSPAKAEDENSTCSGILKELLDKKKRDRGLYFIFFSNFSVKLI